MADSTASSIKNIQITGGAHMYKKKRTQTQRQKRKRQQVEDEEEMPRGPIVKKMNAGGGLLQSNNPIDSSCTITGYQAPIQVSSASPIGEAYKPIVSPAELAKALPVAGPPLPGAQMGGYMPSNNQGYMPSNNQGYMPSNNQGNRIHLVKKPIQKKVQLHSKLAPTLKHTGTKKNRKIILGLVSLKKRQTRALKIKQTMKEMPLAELRANLIKKGLIRPTSKAPESILRQIAVDAQIVSDHAL